MFEEEVGKIVGLGFDAFLEKDWGPGTHQEARSSHSVCTLPLSLLQ
jgi:hypothetical protein